MTSTINPVFRQAAMSVVAHQRIAKWLSPTPCLATRRVYSDATQLFFKAENFQHTGSFKFRGALAKLTTLATDKSIVTASSGNHGLALATAARLTGHRLTVVLPENVAHDKHNKIKALGVETVLFSNDAGLAEVHAMEMASAREMIYVSPYDDDVVIAGQGTIAFELIRQLPKIDTIFVSMGGGGLVSGIGSVIKTYSPDTRVVGVSATNSAALAASIRAETVVEVDHKPTLADGCAGGLSKGTRTLPLAMKVIDEIIECSEEEITEGLRSLAWDEKVLVEGSAGLAFAAWQKEAERFAGKVNVVILCGANFDRETLAPILIPGVTRC